MKITGKLIIFVFTFITLVTTSFNVSAATPPPLPPAAQEAFDKGLRAARQQEWKLAIRYLDEARKAAPNDPAIYFNLALAEGKLPGREWRAIAWFQTYLSLSPEANNAAAVRSQISDLELRGEANVGRIIDMAKELASKFSDAYSRTPALKQVGVKMVEARDYSGAVALARSVDVNTYEGADAVQDIAIALGEAGRYDDADRLISNIQDKHKDKQSWAHCRISMMQSKLGLLQESRNRISRIEDKSRKTLALRELAEAEFKNGKKEQAAATLAEAEAISLTDDQVSDYFKAHLALEDWPGAKVLLARISDKDPDHRWQSMARNDLAEKMSNAVSTLVKAGDMPAAESLAAEIPGLIWQVETYWNMALAYQKQNLPDKLITIQKKMEAAFNKAPRALEAVLIGSRLSQLTSTMNDQAAAAQWRMRALDNIGQALKDPIVVWMDATKNLGSNFPKTYEKWNWSNVRTELRSNLTPWAVWSADEKSLRMIIDVVNKSMPQLTNKADFAESGVRSAIKLAQMSGRSSDIDQAIEALQQYGRFITTYGAVKDLSFELLRGFWGKGDFSGALRVINATSDPETRQRMLDKHHEKEFYARIETADWADAERAMKAISYKFNSSMDNLQVSNKKYLLRDLAEAQKRIGDWSGAQKTFGAISDDPTWRASLLDSLKYAPVYMGDYRLEARLWSERLGALPPVEKRPDWLSSNRALVYSAPDMAEARRISQGMMAEALKDEKPLDRLKGMSSVSDAAGRAGQFEIQRIAQITGLNALQALEAPDWSTTHALLRDGALTDYLGQPAARWRTGLMAEFAKKRAINGNPGAAVKILPQLPADLADSVRLTIVEAYCTQGNIPAAQAIAGKIKKPSGNWNNAVRSLGKALIASGNLAEAKALVAQAWPDESEANALITLILEAGEAEWAHTQLSRYTSTVYRDSISARIIPALAAKTKEWSKATEQFRGNWYYKASFVEEVAKANNPDLALQLLQLPEYINFTSSDRAKAAVEIVAAYARRGEISKANELATEIGRNDERFNARCAIAAEQTRYGDLAAARKTLQSARRQDPRTPPDLDVPSWIGYKLTEILTTQSAFERALPVATAISDEYWRKRALRLLGTKAAKKDVITARNALAAIKDELVRSEAAYAAIADSLQMPAQALSFLDLAVDPGYQAMGIRLLLNRGIALGNVSLVTPRILALPDNAAKACLLNDLLKAHSLLAVVIDTKQVFVAAVQATRAMPGGLLQAYLLTDLANLAPRLAAAQAPALRKQATAAVQGLNAEDARVWMQFSANLAASGPLDKVSAATVVAPVKDSKAEKAAEQELSKKRERAREWTYLADNTFNSPLHMDLKTHLEGLAASVPANSSNKSWDVFNKVNGQVYELLDGHKKIRSIRDKQSK